MVDSGHDDAHPDPPSAVNLKTATMRAILCCLAVLLFLNVFPRAYPLATVPFLRSVVRGGPDSYSLRSVDVNSSEMIIMGSSSVLKNITLSDGEPAPLFEYETKFGLQNAHIYPALIFSLLAAWPLTARGKLIGLLCSVPLVLLMGAVDAYVAMLWVGNGMASRVWIMIQSRVPATPENLVAFKAIKQNLAYLQHMMSFLSSGGRAFLGSLGFLFSLAAALAVENVLSRLRG
ncbi:MAG: hypothetical protein KJ626_09945 [Verrucomicrobia bacterium]|nr:hypothetical protein [Verrucomicrobiota bacterium]